MPRWRALPEELDPQVREFTSQLRRLVDRSGLSVAAVSDRTGYSKTSWERYLNGRLLAPKGAIAALAEVTGTNPNHLNTMWELAERAWSRSEMRHDMTMEAIRISQARAALGEFGPAQAPSRGRGAAAGRVADRPAPSPYPASASSATSAPTGSPAGPATSSGWPAVPPRTAGPGGAGGYQGPGGRPSSAPRGVPDARRGGPAGPAGRGPQQKGGGRKRATLFLAGLVGALLVIAAAVMFLDLTGDDDGKEPVARTTPTRSAATSAAELPEGVKCVGASCEGKDPDDMGCGGTNAASAAAVKVGGASVQVRYSEKCGAAWARIQFATAEDTVEISSGGKAKETGTVDEDGDTYTRMVPVKSAEDAKACATLGTGEKGCTE
ncbi:DUF2690 domain-containing protein [Streptomyces sp. NPDC060194]|uniref:helix-turn-helix domain-containing protein n=1 Tax=Streptomyces sp. NPDC060194 TaxID=3347069 RepID=UPI00364AB285